MKTRGEKRKLTPEAEAYWSEVQKDESKKLQVDSDTTSESSLTNDSSLNRPENEENFVGLGFDFLEEDYDKENADGANILKQPSLQREQSVPADITLESLTPFLNKVQRDEALEFDSSNLSEEFFKSF